MSSDHQKPANDGYPRNARPVEKSKFQVEGVSMLDLVIGLSTVLDQTGAYIFTKDCAGCYTYVNRKVQELFGATAENIIGKDDSHFFDLERTNELRINDRLVIDQGETLEREEINIVKATGETRIYWTIKKPLRNDAGQIIGMCGISTDITERKLMENALRNSENHLRLSQLVGGIGSWEVDLLTGKQTWSEACAAMFGMTAASNSGFEGFLAIVHPEDRPRLIAATQSHFEHNTKLDLEFRVLSPDGERWIHSVGEAERDLGAKPVVIRGIMQDVTERKLAKTQSEQSLSLLQATLESTNDAILVVDLNNKWVLHNSQFLDLWRIPDDIVAGEDDSAALAFVLDQLEDGEAFLAKVLELYSAPAASSFDILKFKNGKIVERYSMPQRINDQIAGRVWSFRDVTEQELAKQALNMELEKNLALLHNASDGIHILDYDGNIIEVSESFVAMLGYTRNEMLGMNVSEWDAVFIGDELLEAVRRQFERPVRSQFETRHRRKDGSVFDVEISGFPLELNGKPALFNSSRDITRRLRVEEALRQKERYQKALLDNFPFAVWLKDTESRFLSVNAGFARIFGAETADELVGKNDFDIAPLELAEGYRADDSEVLASRQNKNTEEAILTAGQYRWFETYKAPVIDANNHLLGTVGFSRDITERKQAEENLHLAASVFTHAREAIMITRTNGDIINVNEAFTRITGYARDEVLGRNPRILSSGQHGQEFFANLWRDLRGKDYWQGEVWNRRKNGELFAEMLTISAVRDTRGMLRHYVALFSDITAQKEHQKQLEHIAHYDALTNLPNRVLFADRLQLAMTQSIRRHQTLAVIYLDLDGFKAINDNYGHEAGDKLLKIVAERMKHALRTGDTLARLGGDEFIAVVVDLDDASACTPMIDRLLVAACNPVQINDLMLQVSASLGVTFYPQLAEADADLLLRQSDQAMYQAKLAGKNRYHVYDPRQDNDIRGYHENLKHIQRALMGNEFVLYYQPKVNLLTRQVIGAEALIRWRHPRRGLLLPKLFLPTIEGDPIAVRVGEWVIETALKQMGQWQAQGFDIHVSVNICAQHLQQNDFFARLAEILALYPRIDAAKLGFEILETSALEDIEHVHGVIENCRGMGVDFALDDFGAGYSSLTYLKRLPVAQIKIDQTFIRGMLEDTDDLSILEGVLGLARAFGREVIAEGLESDEHVDALLQLGCHLAQGFGIAPPMPANELPDWTRAWRKNPPWVDRPAGNESALALLYAQVEHRAWLKSLKGYLNHEMARPPMLDHDQCRLGVWLNGEGFHRNGALPEFQALQRQHIRIHELASKLACQPGDRDHNDGRLRAIAKFTE